MRFSCPERDENFVFWHPDLFVLNVALRSLKEISKHLAHVASLPHHFDFSSFFCTKSLILHWMADFSIQYLSL